MSHSLDLSSAKYDYVALLRVEHKKKISHQRDNGQCTSIFAKWINYGKGFDRATYSLLQVK